jgi:DNA helicase-2/ATP-dependent DNA helicase PcrA
VCSSDLYVAVTRARERLSISRAMYRSRYGGFEEERERSVFWDEIPAHLVSYIEPAEGGARQRSFSGGQNYYGSRGSNAQRPGGAAASGSSLQNASAFFGGGEFRLPDSGLNAAGRPLIAPASSFRGAVPSAGLGAPALKDPHRPGARVQHTKFGHGVILYKEGSGDDTFLTISFTNYGRKKLAVKFAGLKFL